MLEIKNVKVYDLKETVIACRNAMRLDMPEYTDEEFEKGLQRAIKLCKCGGSSGHSSFRKGIRVNFDMKYTQYITKQFQRYHWFDYISSSSLMHRITKMDFDKCCNKYVATPIIDFMNGAVKYYNDLANDEVPLPQCLRLRNGELIKVHSKSEALYYIFMMVISNCPMGTELFVRVTTNYEQLATIARQRKGHKLREDYAEFFRFIKELPYANELILCEKD